MEEFPPWHMVEVMSQLVEEGCRQSHPRLLPQTRCGHSEKPQVSCTLDPWVRVYCVPCCVVLGLQRFDV